nr:MAG: hypothetical protein CM15mV30_2120 [uncultured marine virus]
MALMLLLYDLKYKKAKNLNILKKIFEMMKAYNDGVKSIDKNLS